MSAKTWFSVEIVFSYQEETKRFRFLNCDGKMVHNLRSTIIKEGLQIPIDSGTWVVIFPWLVKSFTTARQEKFFYGTSSDLKTTVFDQNQTVKNE